MCTSVEWIKGKRLQRKIISKNSTTAGYSHSLIARCPVYQSCRSWLPRVAVVVMERKRGEGETICEKGWGQYITKNLVVPFCLQCKAVTVEVWQGNVQFLLECCPWLSLGEWQLLEKRQLWRRTRRISLTCAENWRQDGGKKLQLIDTMFTQVSWRT